MANAQRTITTGIIERNGSYRFTVNLGMDVNGKQIRKTKTWHAPESATTEKKRDKLAIAAYHDFKNHCKGMQSLDENLRFKDLCKQYFSVYAPNKLKPITAYTYEKQVECRFLNYFGNKKISDITTAVLSDFFCNMKKDNGEPVAPSTAKKAFTIMQSIIHFAVSQGYIKENPCNGVILPQKGSNEDNNRRSLTDEELPRFLALFEGYSDFNTMIKVLLYTGMRSGELLGLSWNDIDFEHNQIHINHTLSSVGGKKILTTPKTKSSKRIIHMSTTVRDLLKEHRKHQFELQCSLESFAHPEMVFTSGLGNYKDRNCLNTSLERRLKKTEFSFMTLHKLRHSNATLLLNAGVDIKVVSEHLGHSDIGTTGNIYADILNSTRRKTAEIIEFKLA